MNPHELAFKFLVAHQGQDEPVSAHLLGFILVTACYLIWSVAMVWIIVQSYRQKTFGMPALSTAFLGTLCVLVLIGVLRPEQPEQPEQERDTCSCASPSESEGLFPQDHKVLYLLLWFFWTVLCGILYAQYVIYGRRVAKATKHFRGKYTGTDEAFQGMADTAPRWNADVDYFYVYAIAILVLSGLLQWTFVIFIQDFYVNVTCQLVLLMMAAEYLRLAYTRPFCKGLSVITAWMMAIGNACLYLGILVGGMGKAYPNFTHGYKFMYLVFFLVVALNVLYAVVLHNRDCEQPVARPAT